MIRKAIFPALSSIRDENTSGLFLAVSLKSGFAGIIENE